MDSSVDEKLVGRLYPEGSGQRFSVQMEVSDKQCPSGDHIGIGMV